MCPTPYRMISNSFNKRNPNINLIIQTGDLKFASGDYINFLQLFAKRFFNLEPWLKFVLLSGLQSSQSQYNFVNSRDKTQIKSNWIADLLLNKNSNYCLCLVFEY